MTNKERYSAFCARTPQLPIFMQDWWLDAVCAGKEWDVLLCSRSDIEPQAASDTTDEAEIIAVLPYLLRHRAWMRYILMPQMTQIGGLWMDEKQVSDSKQIADICAFFSRQLEEMDLCYYYQQYPIGTPKVVLDAMVSLGFKSRERITYRIEDLSNLDAVIAKFSKNKKRQLQKALSLHADFGVHIEDFYRFHVHCLSVRKKQISYSREFLLVLERKASRLHQCQIIGIRNADNELLAAAFLVWDSRSMYYLIPCYDETYKDSGASALLALEVIKFARSKGVAFDFEGSMIKGVAQHYKHFGSSATRYYGVERYYKWYFRIAILWNKVKEYKM